MFFYWFWAVAITALTFLIRTDDLVNIRTVKDIIFILFCGSSFALFHGNNSIRDKWLKLIFPLMFLPIYFSEVYFGSKYLLKEVSMFCIGTALFFQFIRNLDHRGIKFFCNYFSILCLMQTGYILLEYLFNINPTGYALSIISPGLLRYSIPMKSLVPIAKAEFVAGSLTNPMCSGGALALLYPFLLRKWWIIFTPLVILAAYGTGSASALAPIVMVSFLFMFIRIKWARIYTILLGITFLIIFFDKIKKFLYYGDRFEVLGKSMDLFISVRQWLIGHGLGFYPDFYPMVWPGTEKMTHPHNEYVMLIFSFGLVGCICFLIFLWRCLSIRGDILYLLSVFSIFVISISGFPLYISGSSVIIIIVFAILYYEKNIKGKLNGTISNSN